MLKSLESIAIGISLNFHPLNGASMRAGTLCLSSNREPEGFNESYITKYFSPFLRSE